MPPVQSAPQDEKPEPAVHSSSGTSRATAQKGSPLKVTKTLIEEVRNEPEETQGSTSAHKPLIEEMTNEVDSKVRVPGLTPDEVSNLTQVLTKGDLDSHVGSANLLDNMQSIAESKISTTGVIDYGQIEEEEKATKDLTREQKIWRLAETAGTTQLDDDLEGLD